MLLKYKAEYKAITGTDYQPAGGAGSGRKDKKKEKENKAPKQEKPKKEKKAPQQAAATTPDDGQKQKQTRLGVEFKKSEALSDWYSQVCNDEDVYGKFYIYIYI